MIHVIQKKKKEKYCDRDEQTTNRVKLLQIAYEKLQRMFDLFDEVKRCDKRKKGRNTCE